MFTQTFTYGQNKFSCSNTRRYCFGFNGQEKDDEITSVPGSHLAFEYRIYDSRIGKFLSVDPLYKDYPWNSTYAFAENRVIDGIDLEGLEWSSANDQVGWLTNCIDEDYENYEMLNLVLHDISTYGLNWLTPLGVIDDAIAVWRNPNSTPYEKFNATFDAAMGTPIRVGNLLNLDHLRQTMLRQ
jgi:RHS repeat-associated protein